MKEILCVAGIVVFLLLYILFMYGTWCGGNTVIPLDDKRRASFYSTIIWIVIEIALAWQLL